MGPTSEYAKCDCQACGQPIEFPAEHAGTSVTCPHCGHETTLSALLRSTGPPHAPIGTAATPPRRQRPIVAQVGIIIVISTVLAYGYATSKRHAAELEESDRRTAEFQATPVGDMATFKKREGQINRLHDDRNKAWQKALDNGGDPEAVDQRYKNEEMALEQQWKVNDERERVRKETEKKERETRAEAEIVRNYYETFGLTWFITAGVFAAIFGVAAKRR